MNPRVTSAVLLDFYRLTLTFTTGESGVFDFTPYLEIGIFNELKDLSYFSSFMIKDGTVVWPNGQDLCPDQLYLECVQIKSAPVHS